MKRWIKDVLAKIGYGFMFGIGLFVAISLSAFILCKLNNESSNRSVFFTSKSESEESENCEEEFKDALKIMEHTDKSDGKNLTIIGNLKNDGKNKWNSVSLEVELFDKDKFVYECNEYIHHISSGEAENFVVSCGGCKDSNLPEYDNYTIRVVSAYNRY